ncbi:MAG: VOC family protein [Chloroflexota bacterium]
MRSDSPKIIGQIGITVSNVEKVFPFYKDILEIPFLFSAGPQLAFLQAGDTRIMLSEALGSNTAPGKNSILYLRADDIETSYEKMVEKGATAERGPELAAKMPDHELWLAFLRDPDGNLVGLMEEKATI